MFVVVICMVLSYMASQQISSHSNHDDVTFKIGPTVIGVKRLWCPSFFNAIIV
jgi:hypothetical protein